ncbi:hypothetical protein HID58_052081, partial [Brassica napus]
DALNGELVLKFAGHLFTVVEGSKHQRPPNRHKICRKIPCNSFSLMDSLVAVDNVTATATTLLRNTILIPNNPHSTSDAKLRRKQKPCCVYNQQCNIHYAKNVFLPAHYFYINGVLITDFPKNPQHVFNNSGGAVTNIVTTPILRWRTIHFIFMALTSLKLVRMRYLNPKKDPNNFNLVDPVERNTIGIPSGGWVVWFMHCHLEVHTTWGLKMAFLVENGKGPNQ